jgi:hypothetical protein
LGVSCGTICAIAGAEPTANTKAASVTIDIFIKNFPGLNKVEVCLNGAHFRRFTVRWLARV